MSSSSAASTAPFVLPPLAGTLLGRLPAWPGSALFVSALNLGLVRQLPDDVITALEGRSLRIVVKDAHLRFDFTLRNGQFHAATRPATPPDLAILANASDFLALARRTQDPDTLFFSRRLVMEGDTELGLIVKNTLDALEAPLFELSSLRLPPPPHVVLRRLAERLGSQPRQQG